MMFVKKICSVVVASKLN